MKHLTTVVTLLALLAGCTTIPPLTREQQLAAKNRHYPNHQPEQVLQAITDTLTLADWNDFSFHHRTDGFTAQRTSIVLTSTAIDTWQVTSIPHESGGTKASVDIQRNVVNSGFYDGNSLFVPTTASAAPIKGRAVYDLFWWRVEYLLDGRGEWLSCEGYRAAASKKQVQRGQLHALCLNAADSPPEKLKR